MIWPLHLSKVRKTFLSIWEGNCSFHPSEIWGVWRWETAVLMSGRGRWSEKCSMILGRAGAIWGWWWWIYGGIQQLRSVSLCGGDWRDLNSFSWGLKTRGVERLKSEARWRNWEDICFKKRFKKLVLNEKENTSPSEEGGKESACVCELGRRCGQKLEESLPDTSQCPPSRCGKEMGGCLSPTPWTRARSYAPGSLNLMLTWDFESGTSSPSWQLQWCSVEMAAVPGVTASLPASWLKDKVYILLFLFPGAALVPADFPSLVLRHQTNIAYLHSPSVIIVSVSFCRLQLRTLTVARRWMLELSTGFNLSPGRCFVVLNKKRKCSKPPFLLFGKIRIRIYILQSCC